MEGLNMSLEQRIECLEHQHHQTTRTLKRWRATCALLVAALVTIWVLGLKAETPLSDVVRTKRIEIINDTGQTVVFMDAWLGGGWIHVANADGATIFSTRADHSGHGVVGAYDSQGQRTVMLGVDKNGAGRIVTKDKLGRQLLDISATTTGGKIELNNVAGVSAATMRINHSGSGEFAQRGLLGDWRVLGMEPTSAAATPDQPAANLIAHEGESVTYDYRVVRTMDGAEQRITEDEYVITMLNAVDTKSGRAH